MRFYHDLIRKLENCSDGLQDAQRRSSRSPFGRKRMRHYSTQASIRKYQSRIIMRSLFGYWQSDEYDPQRQVFLVFKNIDFCRTNLQFYMPRSSDLETSYMLRFILQNHLPIFRIRDLLRLDVRHWHHNSALMADIMSGISGNESSEEQTALLQRRIYLPSVMYLSFSTLSGSIPLFQAILRANEMVGKKVAPHLQHPGFETLSFDNASTMSTLSTDIIGQLVELHGPKLRHLNLKEYRVNGDGLILIMRHCTNLESLSLSCENLSNSALACSFQQLPSYVKLRSLKLRYLQNDDEDEHLLYRTIVERCPSLQHIHIINSPVSGASLREIARNGINLRRLGIIYLEPNLKQSLTYIQSMKSLKRIEFYVCAEVSMRSAVS